MLWANKHRPTTFDEMVGGASQLDYLTMPPQRMQHLLLHSAKPGTGKTTLAHVIANTLGYQLYTFNASSKKTRGIAFVEEELIPLTRAGNYKQIILLDEADQLTPEAQSALKGVIENAQGYFILTCNDISKVSPWLKSRCLSIEFVPLSKESMMECLQRIVAVEIWNYSFPTSTELNLICDAHEGDLRNAINCLQAYASFDDPYKAKKFLLSLGETDLDCNLFLKVCLIEKDLGSALKMLENREVRKAVRAVFEWSLPRSNLTDKTKLHITDAAITAERDIISGVEPNIVVTNFVRMLMQ